MSLIDRIPADVRARAAKAGQTTVDWYAGRLNPEPQGESTLTKERSRNLIRRARVIRRKRRWARLTNALNQNEASS